MKYRTFWHVTPAFNQDSIVQSGVLPSKARNERKLIWFVQWWGLPWALAHVSARWGVPVNQLVAVRLIVPEGQYKHHRLAMWHSDRPQRRGMKILAGDKALYAWEAQRNGKRYHNGHGAKR